MNPFLYGIAFCCLTLWVVLFQWGLFLGKPWGEFTMGGRNKGRLPKPLRWAALGQSIILLLNALVVLHETEVISFLPESFTGGWMIVVLLMMALSSVLNILTPSKKERNLWAPVSLGMFLIAIIIFFC